MALPVGQISLSQVNVELQQGATTTISLNQSNVRALAGVPSGQISMSNLQGKSNYYYFTATISSNTTDYNLRNAAVAAGWNQTTPLNATVTINSGVYVYASSTGTYAFNVSGSFPSGSVLTVINNGFITGRGANGGTGGYRPSTILATPGGTGGPALYVTVPTIVTNNGTIGGGGGGGGGGRGGQYKNNPKQITSVGTNGGGGGGGVVLGTGGSGGTGTPSPASGQPGGTANFTTAGGGGAGSHPTGLPGGAGGALGSGGSSAAIGGTGGAAGAAVVGDSNITWPATGTRLGPIT